MLVRMRWAVALGLLLVAALAHGQEPGAVYPRPPQTAVSGAALDGESGNFPVIASDEARQRLESFAFPQYPEAAKEKRVTGVVTLLITVSPDGIVRDVEPQSGPPLLTGSCMKAVSRWVFHPNRDGFVTTVRLDYGPAGVKFAER